MMKLRSRKEGTGKLPPSPNTSGSMATTAIPMPSTIIMVTEFLQGVKRDFFDIFTDRYPLRLEHPQPGTLQLDAGPCADIAYNYPVNLLTA